MRGSWLCRRPGGAGGGQILRRAPGHPQHEALQELAGGLGGAGNQLGMLVPGCSRHMVPSKARRKPGPILLGAELQSKARAGLPNPDGMVMVPKEPDVQET